MPTRPSRAWQADEELDETYSSLFRELLTHMMEDPRNIGACTHLLFIAKNIERIGDHATNIAETVYFMVVGEPLRSARPKGDSTSYMTVPPHWNIHPLPLQSRGRGQGRPRTSAPDIEGVLRGAYITDDGARHPQLSARPVSVIGWHARLPSPAISISLSSSNPSARN